MSSFSWNEILNQAKKLKGNVEKEQRMHMNSKWAYYFAKAIKKPHTNIKKINFNESENPNGDYISRDIQKSDYLDMCKRLIKYVETNKTMPNYVTVNGLKVKPNLVAYSFAKILLYYDSHNNTAPRYVNINSKAFEKKSETGNSVYDYWVDKFGFKPSSLDEILEYVAEYFSYEYYYDDRKSNKEVIDTRAGNCTDLLQMLVNMVNVLGYDYQVLHVLCSGGDGHVRGKFRHSKNTGGEWIYRDIACVASNRDVSCNWCTNGYTLLDVNPAWFMENLHR